MTEAEFNSLVCAIYDAAGSISKWPDALAKLAATFNAQTAAIASYSPNPAECWGVLGPDNPEIVRDYLAYYHSKNVLFQLTAKEPAGALHTDTSVLPKRVFVRTEFYNDFLVPQGIHAMSHVVIANEGGRVAEMAVHRRDDFDRRELRLLGRLYPHLRRAFEFNVRLSQADLYQAAATEALERLDKAALLVDSAARVLFANRAAEQLFHDGAGLRLLDGCLAAAVGAETARLRRSIVQSHTMDFSGEPITLPISRGDARAPLAVSIAPVRPSTPLGLPTSAWAIVLISDPESRRKPPAELLRQRFGLTRAEAALALEIMQGEGVPAAADRLAVSQSTAKTHLVRIFSKTGTRRQAELVRLLLDLA